MRKCGTEAEELGQGPPAVSRGAGCGPRRCGLGGCAFDGGPSCRKQQGRHTAQLWGTLLTNVRRHRGSARACQCPWGVSVRAPAPRVGEQQDPCLPPPMPARQCCVQRPCRAKLYNGCTCHPAKCPLRNASVSGQRRQGPHRQPWQASPQAAVAGSAQTVSPGPCRLEPLCTALLRG